MQNIDPEQVKQWEKEEEENEASYDELLDWGEEKAQEIELGGRADFFALRKKWSTYLFWFLTATLIFQFSIAYLIGFGLMEFPANSVIYVIVGENFVQIIALVIIVVKFLFSKDEE